MNSNLSQTTDQVNGFVNEVGKRLNLHRMWNVIFWASLIGGGVMLLIALTYVWPGYRVPAVWYLGVFGTTAIVGLAAWYFGRTSTDAAANFADDHFGLKDSVISCLHFAESGNEGGFYDLQSKATEKLVEQSTVKEIPYKPPYRVAVLGALLVLISVSLGFKGPSPEIVERQKQQQITSELTAAANEELKELVEEIANSVEDEEERKLLEPDKLRKWVDELKETTDQKEALRQYARMELKLNRAAEALKQRKDEKLLDIVAEELKKDEASKELGKKLKQKKYEAAAKDLKDLKKSKLDPEKLKQLSEKRKELAKLKAIANRMADASRRTRNSDGKKSGESKKNGKKNGDPSGSKMADGRNQSKSQSDSDAEGEPSDGEETEMSESELGDLIEELDDALEELDEALELAEMEEMDDQDLEESDCEECDRLARAKLDELGKKLMKMAKRRRARAKLNQLSKRCSECQSAGTMEVRTKNKGGKLAGEGSVDSTRDEKDEFADNGQFSKLKGLKGNGPSLTKVESAEDGDGTSHLKHEAKQREFKRQFESFVEREDIPADLKAGVKNYFTNIHESGEEESESENKEQE